MPGLRRDAIRLASKQTGFQPGMSTAARHLLVTFRLLSIVVAYTLAMTSAPMAAPLDLSAYKGKVVYLDFWASWCTPCRLSFPWMNTLQHAYGAKGLVVLAVNVDHDRSAADGFLARNAADFPIVYDNDGSIAETYDFKDMPTSILIGRDGRTRFVHDGFFPEREGEYAGHIQALLSEKAP
jgi:thiol-disulfide isomerase/thioredoxin